MTKTIAKNPKIGVIGGRKVSMSQIINKKLLNGTLNSVTFINDSENKVVTQPISDAFKMDYKGNFRKSAEILSDLRAIQHDNGSNRFTI